MLFVGIFVRFKSTLSHFNGQRKQIVITFSSATKMGFIFEHFMMHARDLLGLSLLPGVTPHVNAMASHQNGRCARIFFHCFVHALLQITFERRIFNDRNDQFFIVSQISTQLMIVNALRRNSLIIFLIKFLLFFFFLLRASAHARINYDYYYLNHFQVSATELFAGP